MSPSASRSMRVTAGDNASSNAVKTDRAEFDGDEAS